MMGDVVSKLKAFTKGLRTLGSLHRRLAESERRLQECQTVIHALSHAESAHVPLLTQALNGQAGQQAIVASLQKHFQFTAAIETGTFLGATAEHLVKSGFPKVATIEHVPIYADYARGRLASLGGRVLILTTESPEGLNQLANDPAFSNENVFFYLDAHTHGLPSPLAEELAVIFRHWPQAVVMIDDFQVPSDPGYAYDDYGDGTTLTPDWLDNILSKPYASFYPSLPSSEETSHKRGSVVLAKEASIIEQLERFKELTR